MTWGVKTCINLKNTTRTHTDTHTTTLVGLRILPNWFLQIVAKYHRHKWYNMPCIFFSSKFKPAVAWSYTGKAHMEQGWMERNYVQLTRLHNKTAVFFQFKKALEHKWTVSYIIDIDSLVTITSRSKNRKGEENEPGSQQI